MAGQHKRRAGDPAPYVAPQSEPEPDLFAAQPPAEGQDRFPDPYSGRYGAERSGELPPEFSKYTAQSDRDVAAAYSAPSSSSSAPSSSARGVAAVTQNDAAVQQIPSQATGPGEASGRRPFLDVRDLKVHFSTEDGLVKSVDGISFSLERGRTLGIVGESGSGKSVTSLSLLGLHKKADRKGRGGARISGEIWLDDEELTNAEPSRIQELRGNKMAMIFQDPLSAMHPYFTVGAQISEAYRVHNKVSKAEARKRTIEMLDRVGIPQPDSRADDYPHQFSGGMRQRAMIAMSLVCNPQLLIADEPTTALDVTVQAQILDLMRDLQKEFNSALIIITHDLGVVAELADDIMVMYGGKAIEYGSAKTVFRQPEHPYTWGLLGSMPRIDREVQDRLLPIPGSPPSLINVPSGCAFHPRCAFADQTGGASGALVPELVSAGPNHLVRCHLPADRRRTLFEEEIAPRL